MKFGYGGSLNGGARSVLTNNGTLGLGSSNGALGKDGTASVAVDGHGTLLFRGYHNAQGYSEISAPIASGQTVELNPAFFGLSMTLADPGDFHGLLKIDSLFGRWQRRRGTGRRAGGRYVGGRPMPARCRSRRVMRRHDAHVPHGLTLLVSHRRGRYGHIALIMAFVGIPMYGHYLDVQRR